MTPATLAPRQHQALAGHNPTRLADAPVGPLEYALEVARVARCGNQRRIARPCPEGIDLDKRTKSRFDPVFCVADLADVDQRLRLFLLKLLPIPSGLTAGIVERIGSEVISLNSVILVRRVVR